MHKKQTSYKNSCPPTICLFLEKLMPMPIYIIYLKTQSKKVKTSTDCFTSADHQEVSKLRFKVSLVVNN